jgi:hypothetical protein
MTAALVFPSIYVALAVFPLDPSRDVSVPCLDRPGGP